MTTVEVELRKFKPIEIRHYRVYRATICTIVFTSFAAMIIMEIKEYQCIQN